MDASPEQVDIRNKWIPRVLLREMPEHVAREHVALPLDIVDGALKIVIAESGDVREKSEKLRFVLNRSIAVAVAGEEEIRTAIDRHYGREETD